MAPLTAGRAVEDHSPRVLVLGGPNGAGKTTTASTLLPDRVEMWQLVNADKIAAGLSPFAPQSAALRAGRLMLERLEELGRQRQDFAFETTLATRSFARFLRRLQSEGYRVTVFYLWLRTPAMAIARVADRVSQGGHHVPDEDVRRRYARGLANFFRLYQPLADSWILCDNSGTEPVTVARGDRGGVTSVVEEGLYDEIRRSVVV